MAATIVCVWPAVLRVTEPGAGAMLATLEAFLTVIVPDELASSVPLQVALL